MSLFDKVKHIANGAQTIREWLDEGGVTVHPADAQRRADVCLKCPENKLGASLSGPVAAAVKRHLEVKSQLSLRVQGEKSLGQCEVCCCQMRLKIWVPNEIVTRSITDQERAKFPSYCWQTKNA